MEEGVQIIRHMVLFNLKPAGNWKDFSKLTLDKLSPIPGVEDLAVGASIDPKAKYRYLLTMNVPDKKTLDAYLNHPIHVKYVKEDWPIVSDFLVLDYELEK